MVKSRGGSTGGSTGRSKGGSKGRSKEKILSKRGLALRLSMHVAIMLILGVIAAVVAHYTLQSATRHGVRRSVPNLHSLTVEEAERVAASNDLKLVVNDSLYAPTVERGTILDQIPEDGTVVKPGRTIYVTINATQQKLVDIPYVAGRSLRQAKNMLEVAGLSIKRLNYKRDLATNYILSQSYDNQMIDQSSNLKAPVGAGITLTVGVSEEQDETVMPQLVGNSLHVAKSALWSAGLNVKDVNYEDDIDDTNSKLAVVIEQSYPADSLLSLGSGITIKMTLDHRRVDEYFRNLADEQELREQMELMDQAIADSLALFLPQVIVEEDEPKVEKVDFEDLFN